MKMNKKAFMGLRIKELRKRKGLGQDQAAERADTSPNYWSRMERGTENPTLDMLIKISDALEVELWELFDFQHEANSKTLRELLKKLVTEIEDEEKLRTAVRLLRTIAR
ncbi:MAG: helix-turn-helix transcriptional regulator [Nitrospirota bacterium]